MGGGTPAGGNPGCAGGTKSELFRECTIGGAAEGTEVGRLGETVGTGAPLGEVWKGGGGTG